MARTKNKKDRDNLEKIKREMTAKKRKAQTQQDQVQEPQDQATAVAGVKNTILDTGTRADAEKTTPEIGKLAMTDRGNASQDKVNLTITDAKVELVVFKVYDEEFALSISNIKQIIRIPSIVKVPDAPHYIIGLCSFNGDLLPIVDSRKIFGVPDQEFGESSRIIVADIYGRKIGLTSDKVMEVITVDKKAVKDPPAGIRETDGGIINGILIFNEGKRVVMILDAEKLVKKIGNFDVAADKQCIHGENSSDNLPQTDGKADEDYEEEQIVIFGIGAGEYAMDANYVKGILRMPDIKKVPNAASHIEGVFSLRNQLLAVINTGKLMGIPCKQPNEYSRVMVVDNGYFSYGLIVDKVSHVVRVRKKLFRDSSRIASYSGTEYVRGIFNLDGGTRLVMLLEPHKLISLDDVNGLLDVQQRMATNDETLYAEESDDCIEYVIFRLGDEEYGIRINNVQAINRIDDITRFPGAPSFIAGMADFRGDVIPMLDLGKLFELNGSDSHSQSKYLVVEFENKEIGILIDSISEVLRISKTCLEEAPGVFGKGNIQGSYVDRIAKLNGGNRIILILNLPALLSFM